MSRPEPFDPQAFHRSNPEMAPEDGTFAQEIAAAMHASHQTQSGAWQQHLLPVAEILEQEDVAVLRQELESAHHLLAYQQRLIDSLTEQLVSQETHLNQVEQDLEAAEHQCGRQSAQLEDVMAVCQDLRAQLRWQQRRRHGGAVHRRPGVSTTPSRLAAEAVVIGYESMSLAEHSGPGMVGRDSIGLVRHSTPWGNRSPHHLPADGRSHGGSDGAISRGASAFPPVYPWAHRPVLGPFCPRLISSQPDSAAPREAVRVT